MALRMRLRRMGAKNNPFYRVVVADARSPRDGRFVDEIGYYNPTTDPATIKIDEEKAIEWLRKGAQPTDIVRVLLQRTGVLEKWQKQRAGA
ncbi:MULTISPECIES: 30S ribosomal protein S16 [Thermaerobacter]|uniref:Small ribosomal subunit protein bS16 n=1 Tax=Thermaerobacter composti TaxID=554949 RepID=A0ABZ0QR19_9FIRM|nr:MULTISPECIES: 30S ribosomal protein S16 [Thermaerobacter]PZN08149.1 MAG: 30S ribosomal protein S16 [Bacillota bacterium]QBS37797.1 30S ribosomal protein S16 [Thermaerobacter sp. FW80]WPD19950.1 30S ribosomal protein S16 [Thermaerobacter composti]